MKTNYNKPSVKNRKFVKSSFSIPAPHQRCVDVSIGEDNVLVTNLSVKDSPIVSFSHDEWDAFIKGVRNGEFEIGGDGHE